MTGLGGTSVNAAWATPCTSAECRAVHRALREENATLRAERDAWARTATDLDALAGRLTREAAARDRVQPMRRWREGEQP